MEPEKASLILNRLDTMKREFNRKMKSTKIMLLVMFCFISAYAQAIFAQDAA